nr:DUF4012 domain-containing protein [Quadrisphaera sp. RL12-1S]
MASHVPGKLGEVVGALRTAVHAVDQAVSRGALPAVRSGGDALEAGVVRSDGSLDPAALSRLAVQLRPAAQQAELARASAAGIDPAGLPPGLSGRVQQAVDGVDQLADGLTRTEALLGALPRVLGSDRPRTYLVGFQNTAELRPTGGIIGTWALLDVTDGRFRLSDAGSNADDLERLTGPVRDFGAEYSALYPAQQSSYSQNVGLSPHFPYAAQLLTDLWTAQGRPAPDGVIVLDPSGLAPLLRGAGAVEVPGGPPVTADDVVDVVLRQAYDRFDGDNTGRKAYLTALVGAAFERGLGGGRWDAGRLAALGTAVQDGHLQIWSADPDEESALEAGGVAGSLPEPATGSAGVYLTNISASKLDYYVHEQVQVTGGCSAPPTLSVGLRNDAPARVPEYVSNKLPGVDPTTETLAVALYLPPGTRAAEVLVDGVEAEVETGTERGWGVTRVSVAVPRGQAVTVQATLDGPVAPITEVHTQPLVHAAEVSAPGCS